MEHVNSSPEKVHCLMNTLVGRIHHKISGSNSKRKRKQKREEERERKVTVMAK